MRSKRRRIGKKKTIIFSAACGQVFTDSRKGCPYEMHRKNKYIRARAKPVINSALRITNCLRNAEDGVPYKKSLFFNSFGMTSRRREQAPALPVKVTF